MAQLWWQKSRNKNFKETSIFTESYFYICKASFNIKTNHFPGKTAPSAPGKKKTKKHCIDKSKQKVLQRHYRWHAVFVQLKINTTIHTGLEHAQSNSSSLAWAVLSWPYVSTVTQDWGDVKAKLPQSVIGRKQCWQAGINCSEPTLLQTNLHIP